MYGRNEQPSKPHPENDMSLALPAYLLPGTPAHKHVEDRDSGLAYEFHPHEWETTPEDDKHWLLGRALYWINKGFRCVERPTHPLQAQGWDGESAQHTYEIASNLYENGVDIEDIPEYLHGAYRSAQEVVPHLHWSHYGV
jgi:hypothetical protein